MSSSHAVNSDPQRLEELKAFFFAHFPEDATSKKLIYAYAPGRSEVCGNHTDHEGGHVVGGTLDVAIEGIACPNASDEVRVVSEGFPQFSINLSNLVVQESEKGTTQSLVRGMASQLIPTQNDHTTCGFDLALKSTIPLGSGLSSSAAVESILGRVMEVVWDLSAAEPLRMAQMAQYSENHYYGKPCGLLDQATICLGGLAFINFEDPQHPTAQNLNLAFEDYGYALCLTNVGSDHAASTDDYASIPHEMQNVAKHFGNERLTDLDQSLFDNNLKELQGRYGDRALLRSVHFWYENDLVDKRWEALQAGKLESFVELTRKSGASSAMFLQNVSTSHSDEQPAMLALALAERALKGSGAHRIHGGGFGGSIQSFIPIDQLDHFISYMNSFFGEGACRHYHITPKGAWAAWM